MAATCERCPTLPHRHRPLCPPPPQVCKYLDMPLQHISNLTLLSMNRPPREHTEKLLAKLRDRIPGLALRTTFISGFPGESDAQHRELVDFVKTFRWVGSGRGAGRRQNMPGKRRYGEARKAAGRSGRCGSLLLRRNL